MNKYAFSELIIEIRMQKGNYVISRLRTDNTISTLYIVVTRALIVYLVIYNYVRFNHAYY